MADVIRLRALRAMWHAGTPVQPGQLFLADPADAQVAIDSGRAAPADDVAAASLKIAVAVEKDQLLRRLAREAHR